MKNLIASLLHFLVSMKCIHFSLLFCCLSGLVFFESCKNNGPYSPDYNEVNGYVIGKEICNIDDSKNYWLINFSYDQNTPRYGDTLILNGITYTNVVKTKNLDQRLKVSGLKVTIDFKTITSTTIETTGCDAPTPVTYALKELIIINQFEIR